MNFYRFRILRKTQKRSPSHSDCERDCSFKDDNIVHSECHTKNSCFFPISDTTEAQENTGKIDTERMAVRAACDGKNVGFTANYRYEFEGAAEEGTVVCASRVTDIQEKIPDIFSVREVEQVVRRETPVLLPNGQIGRLVVYVWQ